MTRTQVNGKLWIGAAKGAILPMATLMLVMFMVVPIPAIVLDIGFITNIMISLAVLMVALRSEEHTSELQSLMRISYAVFCLKKKKEHTTTTTHTHTQY